jgi:hypothetical protein
MYVSTVSEPNFECQHQQAERVALFGIETRKRFAQSLIDQALPAVTADDAIALVCVRDDNERPVVLGTLARSRSRWQEECVAHRVFP